MQAQKPWMKCGEQLVSLLALPPHPRHCLEGISLGSAEQKLEVASAQAAAAPSAKPQAAVPGEAVPRQQALPGPAVPTLAVPTEQAVPFQQAV